MAHRFDDWGRPTAAFAFRDVDLAVDRISAPAGALLVDPFAGSGRSGSFVVGRGDRFAGIEAHPLMGELATLKLARPGSPAGLVESAGELLARAAARRRRASIGREDPVVRRFVPEPALVELAALRDVHERVEGPWGAHLRWLVIDLLRRATGSSWPYRSAVRRREPPHDIGALLLARAAAMADDISAAPRAADGAVVAGDARDPRAWDGIEPLAVAGSVSSPPYLNQVSYAEVTRVELHFLGLVSSWRELTERVGRHLVASSTQQVTRVRAQHALEDLARYPGTTATVEALAGRLARERAERPRGKAYDVLVPCYFADLAAVLRNLHAAMAPGATAAWVLGDSAPYDVHVDTPALVGLLAEEVGFEVVDDVLLRERGGRWRGVGRRHARRLSERLLVFRRPGWAAQAPLPGFDKPS